MNCVRGSAKILFLVCLTRPAPKGDSRNLGKAFQPISVYHISRPKIGKISKIFIPVQLIGRVVVAVGGGCTAAAAVGHVKVAVG